MLFGAAPPVLEESDGRVTTGDGGDTSSPSPSSPSVWRFVKRVPRRALALLSNLPLAIGEMAAIGSLMGLGTVNSMLKILLIYGNDPILENSKSFES